MSAAAKVVFGADSSKLDSALLRVQQSMLKLQQVVAMVHYEFAALKAVGNLISKEFERFGILPDVLRGIRMRVARAFWSAVRRCSLHYPHFFDPRIQAGTGAQKLVILNGVRGVKDLATHLKTYNFSSVLSKQTTFLFQTVKPKNGVWISRQARKARQGRNLRLKRGLKGFTTRVSARFCTTSSLGVLCVPGASLFCRFYVKCTLAPPLSCFY